MRRIVVIGSSNTDLIAKMDSFPAPGETIEGTFFMQAVGGKGGNQALAAHKLGGDVQFVTCLGKDSHGETIIRYYKEQNLDISLAITVDDDTPSGTAMIWVDRNGENCIVVNPGSNARLSPEHIDELEDVISAAFMVVVQFEIPYPTVKRICEIADRNHVKVLLNAAPARKIDPDTLHKIDILVVNETEAEEISGMKLENLGVEAVLSKLKDMGAKQVVLTLGKKGSFFKARESVLHVPAFEVEAVDSTAAGDIFCGALAVGLGKGYEWSKALKFASAASAISVTRLGAQPSIPTEEEVYEFLNQNTPNYSTNIEGN